MAFSSIHFIFLFLPVVLLAYFIIPNRGWKNLVLVLGSLGFFAWSDLRHFPLLLLSLLLNYLAGLHIQRANDRQEEKLARVTTVIVVILNLLILAFYKYFGFLAGIIQSLLPLEMTVQERALPLGISYLTFSALSYILDIQRGTEKAEKNLLRFTAYLVMFPKLLQGPITRYKDVKPGLLEPKVNWPEVSLGIRRFIIGLAKKVLIADSLAIAANKVFNSDPSTIGAGVAWFGLLAFALTIFFDFSGYTDMALGLGGMLGFKLPENFNYPYISQSITDFWRRWHMSLTAWFRTYLFIPLEFKRRKAKFLRQPTNILLVFLLTGLWHGAGWNFIIWGGYFGLLLALEAAGLEKLLKKIPRVFRHLYTLFLVLLGWVFFRITSLQNWGSFLGALFGRHGWTALETMRSLNILFYIPIAVIAILLCLPILEWVKKVQPAKPFLWNAALDLVHIAIFVLCVSYILANGFQAFMYAQF